jgi:hypothetical protein
VPRPRVVAGWWWVVTVVAGCGARTGLRWPDAGDEVACVPRPEVCNRVDDDCNGRVDDIDPGTDRLPACLRIGILGRPGAYTSDSFQQWLRSAGASVERTLADAAPLTRGLLDRYDVVILDALARDYADDEAAVLRDWVTAGGGVIALTGYTNTPPDRTRPNSLLRPFGVAYRDGLIVEGPVTDFTSHAVTEGLASVVFRGGYRVDVGRTVDTPTDGVARFGGEVVGVVQERGAGRVFVWGDEWIEFDTEWRAMPMVQRFWSNALRWTGRLR